MNAEPEDLSRAITFSVEPFGEMKLNIRRAGFLLWVERQVKFHPSADGRQVVRNLLAEEVRFVEKAKPDKTAIADTDEDILNQVAAAIRSAAGDYFTKPIGNDPDDGDVPPPVDQPSTDLTDTSDSTLLWRDLQTWYGTYTARFRKTFDYMLSPSMRIIADLDRTMAPVRTIQSAYPNLAGINGIASQLDTFKSMSALQSIGGISKMLDAYKLPMSPALAAISQIQSIRRHVTPNLSALTEISQSIKAITAMTDQFAFLKATHRQFIIPEWIDRVSAISNMKLGIDLPVYFQPGFRVTSGLALSGLIPAGVGAGILGSYDESDDEDTPYFSGALSAAHAYDATPDISVLIASNNRLSEQFAKFCDDIAREKDSVKRSATISLILAILGLVMGLPGFIDVLTDQSEQHLAKIEEQQKEILTVIEAARAEAKADKNIRYLHHRSPLRTEANSKSPIERYIYPDQDVRVIEVRDDWAYVEVFTYEREALIRGWIYRGNLRIAPAP